MKIIILFLYEVFSHSYSNSNIILKARVRTLFKDILKISQDEDFINHLEADPAMIIQFEEHGEPAPTLNDLHFDLLGDTHSIWNTTVFDMLRKEFLERERSQLWQLPIMSDDYIESIISDRFTRLKTVWMKGMRQLRLDGLTETDAEVQARLIESREVKLKSIRHRERRSTVSILNLNGNYLTLL